MKILLKNLLLNKKKVGYLANLIFTAYPKFQKDVLGEFPKLELKERITWIEVNIRKYIPKNYKQTLIILVNSLKNVDETSDFIFAPMSEFVQKNGCNKNDLKISLKTLGEFTKYFSAEFAIRDFVNKFPEETFEKFKEWSLSKNKNQRRLASEGLRPKLPWAKKIDFDYKRAEEILDNLYFDKSRYVVRSVANHLNDISKIDPDFVIAILRKWKLQNKQTKKEMDYLIKHSLRTSIKKGHKKSFHFLGYKSNPKINIQNFIIKRNKIHLGEYLEFSVDVFSKNNESLLIDYKIIYPNKRNNRKSEKVFKIKKCKVLKNEIITINKKHLFKKMTTKKLYSGKHTIKIQINGEIYCEKAFFLVIPN